MKSPFYIFLVVAISLGIASFDCLADEPHFIEAFPAHSKYDDVIGRSDAKKMMSQGKFTILAGGFPSEREYLIRTDEFAKYGIKWAVVGDVTTKYFEDYRNAFNEVMFKGIEAKYGKGFIRKVEIQIKEKIESKEGISHD